MPSAPGHPLLTPVGELWRVGAEREAQLARLDIRTVGDLLLHRPRRYEDRTRARPIAGLQTGEAATVQGAVVACGVKWFRKREKSVCECILDDGTARLHCRWWNLPFMEHYFHIGDSVFAFGKLSGQKPRTMDHPETEVIESGEDSLLHVNRIVPVYPLTEGLPQRWLRALMWRTIEHFASTVAEPHPELTLAGFPSRADAIRLLHFPKSDADREAARQRLALDEFIELQLAIQRRRRALESETRGLPCAGDNRFMRPFLKSLGFALTEAQTRVLREIRADLGGPHPMRRLLQGDVGSGKTVVAGCAALMALESGFSVGLMAPTEILAEQHFRTFSRWLEPLGLRVDLRTGSRKTDDGPVPRDRDTSGRPPPAVGLVIGTHALIEAGYAPERLGLVIIDEQHKFGVAQRERLVRKGRYPHLLVMTATPIPRTLGLTLYGDLDVSVIDQKPAARGRVRTYLRAVDRLPRVWEFIRARLREGRQAYVVYPRVEAGDDADVKAVKAEWARLQETLAPFQVGLLHGRLRGAEKEQVMTAFREQRIGVLLATSVVEVGVDVANATVLLVENAEQFGLAQLHQLRGRIGRGAHESHCILVANPKTPETWQRLKVLVETSDGFRIAEADLALRGPGELLGREQSGLPPFRFGDLARDLALLERARTLAAQLLARPA